MAPPALCKFFAKGNCTRGEKCRYSHEKTTTTPRIPGSQRKPSKTASLPSTKDPRSQIPCHHYARGNCRNGSNCPYSHVAQKENKMDLDLEPEEKPSHDNFTRQFSGALAQFHVGAQVSKVTLSTDFSAARIDGLPTDSTSESVSSLLSEEGIQIIPECVRVRQQNSTASADIRVDDPTFATRLCSIFRGRSGLRARYPKIEAFHVSAGLPPGTNAHQIECKKVQCSWYKPYKSAWLYFGNEDIAKRVSTKFKSKIYNVLGQTTICNSPIASEGQRNTLTWTLLLPMLPATITEKDITSAITSRQDKPLSVKLSALSYEVEGEEASAIVMSLLFQTGQIEWSQIGTEVEGNKAKGVARYYEESDARAAVATLDNTPLPFSPALSLTVQLISSAKFKVSSSIFSAVQSRIRTASQVWNEKDLKFKIYPSAGLRNQYRVLRIEGEVSKEVAIAKETLNEILDGITVMSDGKPLWTPSLTSNGSVFLRLKETQQKHGVIIVRNKRKQELKLYGSKEKCKEVESIITNIINAEPFSAYIIELEPEDYIWACNGGFRMITATLGRNIASFDIISTPKRILIEGTEHQYRTALRMISKRESNPVSRSIAANESCAVCWEPPESPVLTKCKHVYCSECFELSCNAASSAGKDFSINCHGNMGKCQRTFSLEELQEILSSKAFEDILEASFSTHIQRNPQEFRYCQKPNCNTIYRVTKTMHFNTCIECCTVICTYCHKQHENKTCAEYEDEISGNYEATLEKMKKMGIKECPNCKTHIEKTNGCNHIVCNCGAHLCWVCLETFTDSGLCYKHLNSEHGGIFGLDFLYRFQR
ncbi:58b70620-cdf0-46e4-89e1-1cdae8c87a01 [Sclerotinia trifoliorum]|uniref:58b70620-cdf0-46e4-89e1-1cdae8c87a01 n=1 Tax=Sclerotinia trifoliorum TaxID=28548 RepID=A0A8H2ZLJ7_9HELO|nr:58b70620-cdf0-46e4-89e1-1cdae8c87a01 [Sclerotinia trifoliorum]